MDWMDDLMDQLGLSKKEFSFDELLDDSSYPYLAKYTNLDLVVLFDGDGDFSLSGTTVRGIGSYKVGKRLKDWNPKKYWTTLTNADLLSDDEKDIVQELVEAMEES